MAYLNVNIPPTYAQIKREYLYDLKKHHGEVVGLIYWSPTSSGFIKHCHTKKRSRNTDQELNEHTHTKL